MRRDRQKAREMSQTPKLLLFDEHQRLALGTHPNARWAWWPLVTLLLGADMEDPLSKLASKTRHIRQALGVTGRPRFSE